MTFAPSLSKENKKFLKVLLVLALPIILQEFIFSCVNLLDVLMVGTLGLNAVNGVGLANQINFLCALIIYGVTGGSAIFNGQFWGKGDVSSIHKTMGLCFTASIFFAVIVSIIAFTMPTQLISIYSKEPEVIALGSTYLRTVSFSFFIVAIILTFNAALRSIGQTKIPMITSLVALVFNLSLNFLFIFILKLGVLGAGLATVLSRIAEVTALILIVFKLKLPIAAKIKHYFGFNKKFVRTFFVLTIPIIFNEFIWALGTSLYNVAYQFCGNEAQGAMQVANSINNVFIVVGFGIGSACGIMLANQLGAGERDLAIRTSRKCLFISVTISAVMGGLLLLVTPLILSFYENITTDVKNLIMQLMIIISVGMVIKTYNFTTIMGILRSGGDTAFVLIIDLLSVWLVGVPCAFLGAIVFQLPITTVVILVHLEEAAKLVATTIRVFRNKWANCVV